MHATAPESPTAPAAPRFLGAAIVCLVLSIVFYKSALTVADPDIWGHMRMGLDMWESGRLPPASDPYSYLSPDYPVVDHEWLAQLVMAGVFRLGGSVGLALFKLILVLGTLGLLYRDLCRQGLDGVRGGIIILLVAYVSLQTFNRFSIGLFTFLLFTLLLLVLRRAEQGQLRYLLVVPPLMVLWVNLHPGVLAGLGTLAVWSAAHGVLAVARTGHPTALLAAPQATYLATAAAGALATLVTPYGPGILRTLLERCVGPRHEVVEFMPLAIATSEGAAYLALVGVTIFGLVNSRRPVSLPLLAVLICTSLTPLLAVRHLFLFGTAVVLIGGEHIADAWQRLAAAARPPTRLERILPVPLFLLSAVLIGAGLPSLSCLRMGLEVKQEFPSRAVALLKDSGARGNLVVYFDWGEYVLWHLGPEIRVSVDGRREIAYPEEIIARNFQFVQGAGDWTALLEAGPADLALMPRGSAAFNLLVLKPGWQLVYQDPLVGLFVRQGTAAATQLTQTAPRADVTFDGSGRCFPDHF